MGCAYLKTSLKVNWVSIAFRSEQDKRPALGSHKFCAQLAPKNCKVFGTPRKEKLHKFGQRDCTNCRYSLQLFYESMCVLMQDNARFQRRDHAKLAQKSCKKLENFQKSGTPRAQKNACTRRSWAVHTSQRRWVMTESALHNNLHSDPKKTNVQRRVPITHIWSKPHLQQVPQVLASLTQAYASDKCLLASLTQAYASHRLTCVTCLSLCR